MRRAYLVLAIIIFAAIICGTARSRNAFAANNNAPGSASIHMESAVLLGDGDDIRLLNVPVVSASGETKNYDVKCKLSIGADGTIQVAETSSGPTTMVPNLADRFIAGTYVDDHGELFTLRGPTISVGGRNTWSFQREGTGTRENQKDVPSFNASWTTGPAAGSPDVANKSDLNTLPLGFSYGIADGPCPNGAGINEGEIVGTRQIGDSIQITAFQNNSGNNKWIAADTFLVVPYKPSK